MPTAPYTLIEDAVILNGKDKAFKGGVLIQSDRIVDVFRDNEHAVLPDEPIRRISASGQYLLPGVVDTHVHFRTPGLSHKADISSESSAALAGGVTSIMDMPNTLPQTTTQEALIGKLELFDKDCLVNYGCYLGATNTNLDVIRDTDPGLYCGVKVFMGSSTGDMLVDREEALKGIFRTSPRIIVAHCEDQTEIQKDTQRLRQAYGQDDLPACFHMQTRSRLACLKSTLKAVRMSKETGARLHVAHVSTSEELDIEDIINQEPSDKRITLEACVGHLMFQEADYETRQSLIKCNPSVKTAQDREALWKAVEEGVIDTIATDHAPHLYEEKQGGALKALSGMPMLQFSLVSTLEEAERRDIPLETVIEKMCLRPCQLFGIRDRGAIRKGMKADLTLVERQAKPWTLLKEQILSKCQWSPLEGSSFHYSVSKTFVNGHLAYTKEDGVLGLSQWAERLSCAL